MKKCALCMILILSLLLSFMGNAVFAADEDATLAQGKVYYFNGFDADSSYSELNNLTQLTKITNDEGKEVLHVENTSGSKDKYGAIIEIDSVKVSDMPEKFILEYKVYIKSSDASTYFGTREKPDKLELESAIVYLRDIRSNNSGSAPVVRSTGGFNEWITVASLIDTKNKTRDVYINGEAEPSAFNLPNTVDYANIKTASLKFIAFMRTAGDYAEVDYLKIYSPSAEPQITASSQSYSLNSVYIDFDSTIQNLTPDMIEMDGDKAKSINLIDDENQIYEAVFEYAMEPLTEYTVSVDGAVDAIGRTITAESTFTTRDKEFYIDNFRMLSDDVEITAPISGEILLSANAVNETEGTKEATLISTQYDADGYVLKDNLFVKPVEVTGTLPIAETVSVDENAEKISSFFWKSEAEPIPVSDVKTVTEEGADNLNLTYGLPAYTGEPSIEAKIKEDYSGITVTVDTNDAYDRLVGLSVNYKNEIEYLANGKTENGVIVFDVPLKESNVGSYSVTAGIEKGGIVKPESEIEFYSPVFIQSELEEKINSSEADEESVEAFVSLLGNYLGLDMEALYKLDDESIAYNRLLVLRDENEENTGIPTGEDFAATFSVAVKLALIYEGKDTVNILTNGGLINSDEEARTLFCDVISGSSKEYVAEKLKNKSYDSIQALITDVKKYAMIGGFYKAEHYTNVDTMIKTYAGELGINLSAYNKLKRPDIVAGSLIGGKEYNDFDSLASAVNSAISARAREEAKAASSHSGGGGGGGGGGGISSNLTYPNVKEDKKETAEPAIKEYNDVVKADWFYNDVMWATKEGWFIGTGEATFSPAMKLTWEHIVIVLERMGYKAENLKGKAEITRGEFAELLYGFLADKSAYKSRDEWISKTKIFIGDQNGNMMFDKSLTRAECCTLLRRIEDK